MKHSFSRDSTREARSERLRPRSPIGTRLNELIESCLCAECMADSTKLCHELVPQDRFLGPSPLHPLATATCVRVHGDNRITTDGPFAETTEQLGGYFLVEAANLDEAIAIAGRIPAASQGTVEIRPVFELSGLSQYK